MGNNTTLREFCNRYRNGEFYARDRKTQISAGWFDWFCGDDELAERLVKIWEILRGITSDFILDNFRISLKNHMPASGSLYDSVDFIRLNRDLKDSDLGISISDERESGKYAVYSARNEHFTERCFNDVQDVWDFINNWESSLQDKTFREKQAETREFIDNFIKDYGL